MRSAGDEAGSAAEPIAIIGMGCRFPGGADDPEKFWDVLHRGVDGIRKVPDGRWAYARYEECEFPEHLRYGGYLEQIEGFDAGFFGIAPRDALNIDPQQRLLLEVTWEALWDAGIEPAKVSGQPVGVFAGIGNSDYLRIALSRVTESRAPNGVNSIHSIAAGRISFLLNLTGPCIAIDTACSSSLVTTHLACQSLRARECDMAISGGVSLKPLPDEMLTMNRLRALSRNSRCLTFDANADGFVIGEGCGMIVLKRLADAVRDGDRVRAVIRGSAVNHDGRTAVLTLPSASAQEALLRYALKDSGVEAEEISFIETHGTATPKGDPMELQALHAVFGSVAAMPDPCLLGAVKTNVGHLEAAAGVAGVIKAVLAMEHEAIPKNLHFTSPNPDHWPVGTRLKIAEQETLWPRGNRPRIAGISSFGLSGTNAHVIVAEGPATKGMSVRAPLPPRAWQRTRYWLTEPAQVPVRPLSNAPTSANALAGARIKSPFLLAEVVEFELDSASGSSLNEKIEGSGQALGLSGLMKLAKNAAFQVFPEEELEIVESRLMESLSLADPCKVQVAFVDGEVKIVSGVGGTSGWTTHLTARYGPKSLATAKSDSTVQIAEPPTPVARGFSPAQLEQIVRKKAADVMGIPEEEVLVDDPLITLGLDSIMAMDLQQELQTMIGQPLPNNLAFSYPSVADIARVIATILWAKREGDGGLMASGLTEEVEI